MIVDEVKILGESATSLLCTYIAYLAFVILSSCVWYVIVIFNCVCSYAVFLV